MVSTEQILAFGVAALILIVIPGPTVVFVVGRALAYGRAVGLTSALGNGLGLMTLLALVAFGLGRIVEESIAVYTAIKLIGAAYLVFLGVQALRHRRAFAVEETGPARAPLPLIRALRQGYVVGVSNPKGLMIFAAVLPQFVDRSVGHPVAQMLTLGLMAFGIALVSDSAWAMLAARVRSWFGASKRRGEALGVTGGLSMIGLGIGVAVSGHPRE